MSNRKAQHHQHSKNTSEWKMLLMGLKTRITQEMKGSMNHFVNVLSDRILATQYSTKGGNRICCQQKTIKHQAYNKNQKARSLILTSRSEHLVSRSEAEELKLGSGRTQARSNQRIEETEKGNEDKNKNENENRGSETARGEKKDGNYRFQFSILHPVKRNREILPVIPVKYEESCPNEKLMISPA
ncbi:hypothetical protein H6P81_012953 [Aristolochia fimbriata]|uniref:Uncharacterized protein n=1 Tax=Aristolochia fimbriata TaxID=158543 RepID=A0AAV7EDB3_ARIFI|nr:hypothetical protein H6P81_012953 [Aristolochia fimbriata]